jgi:hypothetical protein
MPGGLSICKADPFTGVGMLLKYKVGEKTIVVPFGCNRREFDIWRQSGPTTQRKKY